VQCRISEALATPLLCAYSGAGTCGGVVCPKSMRSCGKSLKKVSEATARRGT
jgi:hypothetical protein